MNIERLSLDRLAALHQPSAHHAQFLHLNFTCRIGSLDRRPAERVGRADEDIAINRVRRNFEPPRVVRLYFGKVFAPATTRFSPTLANGLSPGRSSVFE